MTINRNNYEAYFLLYIDNELSVAEKNMVDVFAAANPDLQEELVMLQQSVIKPMNIDFPEKEKLLKPEAVDAATEEKLLLLLDNELKGKEKAALLSLIQYNKNVQYEWELLQQTKLSYADTIIFKDKASLYKKEEGKVVAIKWWRVAAAAMLIGFGLWGTVSYIKNDKQENTIVETAGTTNTAKEDIANIIAEDKSNSTETRTIQTDSSVKINITKSTTVAAKNKEQVTRQFDVVREPNDQKNNQSQPAVAANNKKQKENPTSENFNNNGRNEKVFVNVTPQTQTNNIDNSTTIPSEIPNSIAINTSFKNNAGGNNDFAFEDDEDKPKKTKLGGFFKRVKRVVERKTKIKTGDDDEVRIANMSFAMQ
jgi:hypothetical protein